MKYNIHLDLCWIVSVPENNYNNIIQVVPNRVILISICNGPTAQCVSVCRVYLDEIRSEN